MDICNKNCFKYLSRKISKIEPLKKKIKSLIQSYNDKYKYILSNNKNNNNKNNIGIESYKNKNIFIHNINSNINHPFFYEIRNSKSYNANKSKISKLKRINSSYYYKYKNLYLNNIKSLSEKRINNKIKFSNKSDINNYFPKILNKKSLIFNVMKPKSKSISLSYKNEALYNEIQKIKLPRINSNSLYINNNIRKKPIRCISSLNISKIGVKSIYIPMNLTKKKEENTFNKKIFLKKNKRKFMKENSMFLKKLNYYFIDSHDDINKKEVILKEKGKEYNFIQKFNIIDRNIINDFDDGLLLNDKGTIID